MIASLSDRRSWLVAAGWGALLTLVQITLVCVAGTAPCAHGLQFSPDSRWLAAINDDWTVRVWDLQGEGTAPAQEFRPEIAEPVALLFRDDDTLLTAQSDLSQMTWYPLAGSRLRYLRGETGGIHLQSLSADGNFLAFAHARIYVRDLRNQETIARDPGGQVGHLALNADGTQIAFSVRHGDGHWSLGLSRLAESAVKMVEVSDPIHALVFATDPAELAVAVGTQVILIDPSSREERKRFDAGGVVQALAWSRDGQTLAAGTEDGNVLIWNRTDARVVQQWQAQNRAVTALACSPDGRSVATTSGEAGVRVWHAESGREVMSLQQPPAPAWLARAYRRLARWDVHWYARIATAGYRSEVPPRDDPETSNVAFFPGMPLLTRLLHWGLGINGWLAAIVASQLAAWGFWTYLFRFFQRWGLPARIAVTAALVVLVHPAAFYLVNGYSESLFLWALLGFLYWEGEAGQGPWILAAIHGFIMTATRLVGLPIAMIPVGRGVVEHWRDNRSSLGSLLAGAGLAAITLAGGVSFFCYCAARFGQWNLYMLTQEVGWHVQADYAAPLHIIGDLARGKAIDLNWLSVLVFSAFFGLFLLREWQTRAEQSESFWHERVWFYAAAAIMFYISVCGLYRKDLASMIRYSLAIHVMFVLAAASLVARYKEMPVRNVRAVCMFLIAAGAASLGLQIKLIREFTIGYWVA